MSSPLESEYFIELAEQSLTLGDSDAALNLLNQISDEYRSHAWATIYVETLRFRGEFEMALSVGIDRLGDMILNREWEYARRVLVECGRAFDAMGRDSDCINFLCSIAGLQNDGISFELLFNVQLVSILSSRIADNGDVATADRLMSLIAADATGLSDRKARASVLWVRSEIEQLQGDVDCAIACMEQVHRIYLEENDKLATMRIVMRLGYLATNYLNIDYATVRRIDDLHSSILSRTFGDANDDALMWLMFTSASIARALGDIPRAIENLHEVKRRDSLEGFPLAYLELLYGLCYKSLGEPSASFKHLQASLHIFENELPREWVHAELRTIGYALYDLGLQDVGKEIIARAVPPAGDYTWCLEHFTFPSQGV